MSSRRFASDGAAAAAALGSIAALAMPAAGGVFRRMRLFGALALGALLFISGAGAQTTAQTLPSGLRILYASDWAGTMEIFAADPSGRVVGRLTFARPEGVCSSPAACGYVRPQPSPDGRP